MLKRVHFIVITIFLTTFLSSYGQKSVPIVDAKLSIDSIAIGDQFELEVTVSKDIVQIVEFPIFDDKKIGDLIEILSESEVDTISQEGRNVTLLKRYKLTSFDAGNYSLGKIPVLFVDKNIVDTLWSRDSIMLEVATFEIDTTKQVIHDIKRQMEAPLKFGEVGGYVLWGSLILLLIGFLIYYIVQRRANRPILGRKKEVLPPHIVAIKALVELKNKKVWQSSKHKLYYTSLTDILREYIEGRFDVRAMEMTSDEIVSELKEKELTAKKLDEIKDLLYTADLVKFAKVLPDADQNENNYDRVYYFVEDTKSVESEIINNEEVEL